MKFIRKGIDGIRDIIILSMGKYLLTGFEVLAKGKPGQVSFSVAPGLLRGVGRPPSICCKPSLT